MLGGRGGNLEERKSDDWSLIQFIYSKFPVLCVFLPNVEILRRCKEGLGVGLQAKYRHIRNPNRGRSAKDKYYVDDGEKYEKQQVLIFYDH